jgi:hypothetical protein
VAIVHVFLCAVGVSQRVRSVTVRERVRGDEGYMRTWASTTTERKGMRAVAHGEKGCRPQPVSRNTIRVAAESKRWAEPTYRCRPDYGPARNWVRCSLGAFS